MESSANQPTLAARVPARSMPTLPQDLGLLWRALNKDDAVSLSALITTIEKFDHAPFQTSFKETLEILESDWSNFPVDSIVAQAQDGSLVAYGLVHHDAGDDIAVSLYLDGGVHPAVRDVGIGRSIVEWLTARAHNKLREIDSTLPAAIYSHVQDSAEHDGLSYERSGFTVSRYFRALRREVARPIDPVLMADHLRLLPYSVDLAAAVDSAHQDAFRDHLDSHAVDDGTWEQMLAVLEPEWSFVVVDETASEEQGAPVVAGYVLVSRYDHEPGSLKDGSHESMRRRYSSGYVEALGVRKVNRGQKIALALLTSVVNVLNTSGIEFIELDVDSDSPHGGLGLYEHLGFKVVNGSRMFALHF